MGCCSSKAGGDKSVNPQDSSATSQTGDKEKKNTSTEGGKVETDPNTAANEDLTSTLEGTKLPPPKAPPPKVTSKEATVPPKLIAVANAAANETQDLKDSENA